MPTTYKNNVKTFSTDRSDTGRLYRRIDELVAKAENAVFEYDMRRISSSTLFDRLSDYVSDVRNTYFDELDRPWDFPAFARAIYRIADLTAMAMGEPSVKAGIHKAYKLAKDAIEADQLTSYIYECDKVHELFWAVTGGCDLYNHYFLDIYGHDPFEEFCMLETGGDPVFE